MTIVEIPDAVAAGLRARAAALGLSLEEWLAVLAEEAPQDRLVALFERHVNSLSEADLAWMPRDGASEHDHYIYGLPMRQAQR